MKQYLATVFGAITALAALFASGQAARAQTATYLNAPSPEKVAVTSGGVDIRTGRYAYEKTDVSIGDGGGAIAVQRTMTTPILGHSAPFGNFSHNWDILLTIKSTAIASYPGSFDYTANINFGGRSQTFQKIYTQDTIFRQKSQNDTTRLTNSGSVYTYEATDGTVAVFQSITMPNSDGTVSIAQVSYVIEPDGTRFDFEYDSSPDRLRSVTSSRGYAALFEYSGSGREIVKSCVLNLGVTAKPSNNVCPGGAPETSTYSYSTLDSKPVMTGATGPDSNSDSFGYSSITSGVSFQMTYTKPGQSTPWQTQTNVYDFTTDGLLHPIVGAQSFADGSSFAYGYDYTPQPDNGYQTVSGGAYVNALGEATEVRYDFPATPGSFNPPRVPGSGPGTPPVNFGDIVYQVTPGPALIVDALGRETKSTYCDPVAEAGLPSYEHHRCLVTRLQTTTDDEGNSVELKYGVNNNVIEIKRIAKPGSSLADTVESATYDGTACSNYLFKVCNKPLTVTDAKGKVTDYTWDDDHGGMLTETLAAPSTGADRPQKRYSYDEFYAWYKNSSGTIVQSSYPVWLLTEISECKSGVAPTCVGTANETRTTISYATGNSSTPSNLLPVSRTVAAGDNSISATVNWTYDELGNKLTEDGPLSGTADTTRWRYDARRRVIGMIGPDPDGSGTLKHRATRNTYDAAGRITKVEQGTVDSQSDTDWAAFAALQTVDAAYDALDRKTKVWSYGTSGGTQALRQYSYDLAGRLECSAVRMNPAIFSSITTGACSLGTQGTGAGDYGPDRITKLTYDAAGQLTKTTLAYGTTEEVDDTANTYTDNGKLATVTDAEDNRTTFEYDGHDRLKKTRYPVATLGALTSSATDYEELTYDDNDNVTEHRKRDGQMAYFTYDALNRMTAKNVPNSVIGELDVTTTYDNLGRPITVADTASNNVGSIFDALGRMTQQSSPFGNIDMLYDTAGRMTKLTHPDGAYFQYHYNVSDLVIIQEKGRTPYLAEYSYDDLGRRRSITRANATTTSIDYDPVGRLKSYAQDLGGTGEDLSVRGPAQSGTSIAYNPAGQLTDITRSNPTDLYAWTGHYNVNRDYGTNGLNQLTSAGATSLGYDGRGNLTSSGSSTYTYTSENRLATAPGGVTMTYDPTGRLSRLTEVVSSVTVTDIRFEYLGPRLISERDASGNIIRRYVHGPGDDEPVVWYEGAGLTTRRFLHTDERGSVIAVSDNTGASIATIKYDEYGIPQSSVSLSTGTSGRFLYTGQAFIPEVGLYYYKARMYSPTLGRFMQTDPIGYSDGINWYAYVKNDPINAKDPSGLCGSGCTYTTDKEDKNWAEAAARSAAETAAKVVAETAFCANKDCSESYINPRPGGQDGPIITFQNDDANGASPNRPVTTETAKMVEGAVVESGVDSVNINSTTGGGHEPTSRHFGGRAVDINMVNGRSVLSQGNSVAVSNLQDAFSRQPNIRENFGPSENTKRQTPGGPEARVPSVEGDTEIIFMHQDKSNEKDMPLDFHIFAIHV